MSGTGGIAVVESRRTLQSQGRALLIALHGAAQAMKLYPYENQAVSAALGEVHRVASVLFEAEGAIELRVSGDFVFLNDLRLRLELANFGAFSFLTSALRRHGIGSMEVLPEVREEEWGPFIATLLREASEEDEFGRFLGRLTASPATSFKVEPAREYAPLPEDEETKEAARRTYARSVQVAREVLTDARLGRAINIRRVKRSIQDIVDHVLTDDASILSMTALREYDEYTFTHSVNVCIFSVVLGQKLGFGRPQLYELGLGALLHDIGKTRLDPGLLNKGSNLSDAEWDRIRDHPTDGLLALFSIHGFGEIPYRAMLIAYEHHMGWDLRGYPRNRRPRRPTLFSRIVAVADGFDAATSRRSYQAQPWPPDRVLREMRDNPKRGYDPLLVKAFINVTGVYPVGTLAILDTFELALVVGRKSDPTRLHQPVVRILADPMGIPLAEPELADLADVDPATGKPRRTIIKTTDPEKYGVRVDDYLV